MADISNELFLEGAIKVVLSSIPIPVLGPILSEIMFDMPGRIKLARFESLMNQLKNDIIDLQNHHDDYFKSESFYDLTYNVFEKSLRTQSVEKHRILSKIYIDFINHEIDFESDLKTIYLDYALELKPLQFKLLALISEIQNELVEIESFPKFYDLLTRKYGFDKIDKDEFKLHVNKLESLTLISTGAGLSNFDDTSCLMALEDHRNASVIISSIGSDFIRYVSE